MTPELLRTMALCHKTSPGHMTALVLRMQSAQTDAKLLFVRQRPGVYTLD